MCKGVRLVCPPAIPPLLSRVWCHGRQYSAQRRQRARAQRQAACGDQLRQHRAGVRVAVARASAYDLYLTRALKHAKLVREANGPDALALFRKERLEAAAGVKQPIVAFAREHPDTRVIPGRFMVIEQAMGTP